MTVPLLDRRDLDLLLFNGPRIELLLTRSHYVGDSLDTLTEVLDISERLDQLALPALKSSGRCEPEFNADGVRVALEVAAAVRDFAQAGLPAGRFDENVGGLQLPHYASMALCMADRLAAAAHPMLSIANVRLPVAFGTGAQIEAFAPAQIRGARCARLSRRSGRRWSCGLRQAIARRVGAIGRRRASAGGGPERCARRGPAVPEGCWPRRGCAAVARHGPPMPERVAASPRQACCRPLLLRARAAESRPMPQSDGSAQRLAAIDHA